MRLGYVGKYGTGVPVLSIQVDICTPDDPRIPQRLLSLVEAEDRGLQQALQDCAEGYLRNLVETHPQLTDARPYVAVRD